MTSIEIKKKLFGKNIFELYSEIDECIFSANDILLTII